jgi:hypothetical protein
VSGECFDRIVVLMDDVGDRIHRERQQQADERSSQPCGWFPCQVENGHSAGWNIEGWNALERVS